MTNYRPFLEQILAGAAIIAQKHFGAVTGEVKGTDHNQVLTIADTEIGNYIVSEIRRQHPEHDIIDEEAGSIDNHSDFCWVIDPIDGTSNFASGIPLYAIMMGLLIKGIPIAGGIILPAFNELYIAQKDQGTQKNGKPVQVTQETNLLKTLVSYMIDGHQENPQLTYDELAGLGEIILKIRNLRTAGSAYDIAMVAQGSYGATLNRTSKIWDCVAPQILIEEAGGVYTDFWGKPMDYTSPHTKIEQNFTTCAASPSLHKALQEIIATSR